MSDSVQDRVVDISEGNPGALTALQAASDELNQQELLSFFDELEQMNITGPRVWLVFKDHCGHDVHCFIDAVQNSDQQMIELVNERSYDDKPDVVR